jgi:hypothetical protein
MLSALSDAGADYLVVGAHALAAHGVVRATGDLDIWVDAGPDNAARVWSALQSFGAPLDQLRIEDLVVPDVVFQIGLSPNRIDILTSISGVTFEHARVNSIRVSIFGLSVPVIGRDDLIQNKRAVGRLRDLADIAELTGQGID